MFTNMEIWAEIRRQFITGEKSIRQLASEYDLNFRTVQKIVHNSEPQPYQQRQPRQRPQVGKFLPIIGMMIESDRHAPSKQKHTARRIFERLRDEYGYKGCSSVVREAVREYKERHAEAFIPLLHPPGEAQVDFGHAEVVVAGVVYKAALFTMTLPHSNARFGCLFPRECTEAFQAGHARAFDFFGGVPSRISYDNTKIAVKKLVGPHERELTDEFLRLQSHFCFKGHFCRVRKPQEKGHVENGVGYIRRNFLVPVPHGDCWEALNVILVERCQSEQQRKAPRLAGTTAELLEADRAAFLALPSKPFEAHRCVMVSITSQLLGRFDGNDYSVPTAMAYQCLTATGTIDVVRFTHRGIVVAEHRRCWSKGQVIFDPLHYLALLERKPGALDYAKPLANWNLPAVFATLRQRLEQTDPKGGTRKFIQVLLLIEKHGMEAVSQAVERALSLQVIDAGIIRLLLQQAEEQPTNNFDLSGRPSLHQVSVPAPDLSVYGALTQGKEAKA